MALPKINDLPSYEMVIPSTSQKTRYRPFLVKEQKVLLMALESKNSKEIINSIVDTIDACVEGVDARTLATFDIEYMFTKIRSKSVGETSKIAISCSECKTANQVTVDLDKIEVKKPDISNTISLGDNISIKLRYPSYNQVSMNVEASTYSETIYNLVITSLDVLKTEDEVIKFDDEDPEEVKTFINNLTTSQYEKLTNFVNSLPTLSETVKFECSECGHTNTRVLRGIEDFF